MSLDLLNNLEQEVASAKKEAVAFYEKGNNAAGTRLRKHLQTVKVLSQEIRNAVSEAKNAGK